MILHLQLMTRLDRGYGGVEQVRMHIARNVTRQIPPCSAASGWPDDPRADSQNPLLRLPSLSMARRPLFSFCLLSSTV